MKEKANAPRSRSQQQIFQDMYRELRAFNTSIPESSERLDPVMRMMLEVFSHQVERVDKRLDLTWDVSTSSLIKSVCPEHGRRPVPAYTVMRCKPIDPVIDVDTHTKFFYKEKREGGQTFFFSPECESRVIAAETKKIYLCHDDSVFDLSPLSNGDNSQVSQGITSASSGRWQMFVAVDYSGPPSGLQGAVVFLTAAKKALNQLSWGQWYPGAQDGSFYMDAGFCPGLVDNVEDALGDGSNGTDWGGMRSARDLFIELEDSFVALPPEFTTTWELGPIDRDLARRCGNSGVALPPEGENFYWIRIDLSPNGDRRAFQEQSVGMYFDCLIATNKNELTLFKHTGANKLVEIEITEKIEAVLEIVSVVDSSGNEYRNIHDLEANPSQWIYVLEERHGHLVLWFDFSDLIESSPDSITVTYAVTAGTAANGIDAGHISDLYESHPGLDSVGNVITTTGAIPARTQEQLLTEVSTRLRQRDRATTFKDVAAWTRTFDPRIHRVDCNSGIVRGSRGVHRCIVVTIALNTEEFFSEDEISLLQKRLNSFLKMRSTVNTQYVVEVAKV
ncbi:MAG: hypothetical protein U9N55_00710 [candidate division Zixibacteria bacterium]|nr:hypothetical protein [candidate division Zixibacteria bacterium]